MDRMALSFYQFWQQPEKIDTAWGTQEYDEMTLHVMFQPFDPEGRGIEHRVKIVGQLIKEKKGKRQ